MAKRFDRNTSIGPFVLLDEIADHGGTASVYRAVVNDSKDSERHNSEVALKIARNSNQNSEIFERLLRKETELLTDLRHPGVVRILPIPLFGRRYLYARADKVEGAPWYFAMELMKGGTVADLLQSRRYNLRWRVELLYQVATVLDYLHLRDVAHRDLKPENIMLRYPPDLKQTPTPVLIDFGLAEKRRVEQEINAATISHAAPERVEHLIRRGSTTNVDGIDQTKSDVWALGIIAYELFNNGAHPFGGADQSKTIMANRITNERPLPYNSPIPTELQNLVDAMMSKSQANRPALYQVIQSLEKKIEILPPRI